MPQLDNLRKEAKRWLKALRENDPAARERLVRAYPAAPDTPVLRDVQHALAREHGFAGWAALKQALEERAAPPPPVVARFLEYACPDHHVRGLPAHRMARHAAMRILEQNPSLARASLYTAVVCGEIETVEALLRDRAELANAPRPAEGPDRSGPGNSLDFLGDLGGKDWTPLLFLAFTRLPLARSAENAVEIARMLLDRGADPNASFRAGGSVYTPLVGVIGEGEEGRPPHPRRDELARLLLEHGARPEDEQVLYNIHFQGKILWWLKLMREFSANIDWRDPRFLRIAIEKNDRDLAGWCLEQGADPNLYQEAARAGRREIAELLAGHGAERVEAVLNDEEQYVAACLRLDREEARRLLALHPEYRESPTAMFAAAREDRADAAEFLLELGTPLEVEDSKKQRALHVAAGHDALAVARLLLERGAEIDPYEQRYDNTPLGFAVHLDYTRIIQLLVRRSRDVWNLSFLGEVARLREVLALHPRLARVSSEATPLFWLPEDEDKALEIAGVFVEHGADPGFRHTQDGTRAAAVARRRGMPRVADFLESAAAGADADLLSRHGESTPEARDRIAREHGHADWAAFVASLHLDPRQQAAHDFVGAYEGDAEALRRLNDYYHRSFTLEDLKAEIWRRVYAFRQRSSRIPKNYLALEEAQTLIAQDAGYSNWPSLMSGGPPEVDAWAIDPKQNRISPRRRLTPAEWDGLAGVIRERRITGVDANGLMTDAALARIAGLDCVTTLNLGGSRELSDDGLLELARMPQIENLELSEYPGGKLTDRGLEVLRRLPNLRTFEMTWQAGITDAGVANLRHCEQLERVNLMGSPTGDGAIEALQGKAKLRRFATGRLTTNAGLAFLQNFPALQQWRGEEAAANLLIDGPFTDRGLATLAGLEGIGELDLFWHVSGITPDGFAHLVHLPNLLSLGCDGDLSGNAAMAHIAAMPRLQRLRCQESAADDDGFVALSRSQSLQGIWGRECPRFGNRGFLAFSKMPALRRLGIGCRNVDDQALAAFPDFPGLRELTPIGVPDAGFRHVGRCARLERLTCMYCRDTTDAATGHIAALALKYYYAGLTQITDRSLEILGRMSSLEQVDLYECLSVTDAGLPFLAALPRLKEVHLDGLPGVTLAGTRVFPASVRVSYST